MIGGLRRRSTHTTTGPQTGRPRPWRWILILVLAVVVAGAGVWLVAFSSVLAVREATVEGTAHLTEAEVREAAQVPIGLSLARVDTGEIAGRIAELPPVRDVRVSRAWPHSIRIVVTERTTVFVARQAETFWAVDETGTGFIEVAEVPDNTVVADDVPEAEWAGVATVVGALPTDVAERAERITTRGPDAIVIHLTDDVTVEWGSAEHSAEKASVLTALLEAVPDAKVYNVSAPQHPTTTGGVT